MKQFRAFVLGMVEFRHSFTTRCSHDEWYDRGRELAHVLTLRRYD